MADITYIHSPGVVSDSIIRGGTLCVMATPGGVIPVVISGGSVSFNINPGDVNIGNVGIYDSQTGYYASVHHASDVKQTTETVLTVQHIDDAGGIIKQSTQESILDAGSKILNQATQSLVVQRSIQDSNAAIQLEGSQQLSVLDSTYLEAVTTNSTLLKVQDTGSKILDLTDQALTMQEATQDNSAAIRLMGSDQLSVVENIYSQTSTGNTILAQIQDTGSKILDQTRQSLAALNTIASGSVYSPLLTLLDHATYPQMGPTIDSSGYLDRGVQFIISGSVVADLMTSLDGINWDIVVTCLRSKLFLFSAKTRYTNVRYRQGNGTLTVYALRE